MEHEQEINLQTVIKQEPYDCIHLNTEQSSLNAEELVNFSSNSNECSKSDDGWQDPIRTLVSFEEIIKIESNVLETVSASVPVKVESNEVVQTNEKLHTNQLENVKTDVGLKCGDCGLQFTDPYHTHHVCFPYQCAFCSEKFIKKHQLSRHISLMHPGPNEKRFQCEFCLKIFKAKCYLMVHMRIHTGEQPYICHICNKGFKLKYKLKIHVGRAHSTDEMLKASYKLHANKVRAHSRTKSFACEFCTKTFKYKMRMNNHMRIHAGEKQHVCEICSKRLKGPRGLKLHIRSHACEKPRACKICDRKFKFPYLLKAHMRKHSNIQMSIV